MNKLHTKLVEVSFTCFMFTKRTLSYRYYACHKFHFICIRSDIKSLNSLNSCILLFRRVCCKQMLPCGHYLTICMTTYSESLPPPPVLFSFRPPFLHVFKSRAEPKDLMGRMRGISVHIFAFCPIQVRAIHKCSFL